MCEKCNFISGVFELINSDKSDNINQHRNFTPTFFLLKHFEKWGDIELYAGDCTTKEFDETEDKETHYTWCFYFKCKTCGKYFFIGACIRGTPIYKIYDKLTSEDLRILWGKSGTYFER